MKRNLDWLYIHRKISLRCFSYNEIIKRIPGGGFHRCKRIENVHGGQERVHDIEAQAIAAALSASGEVRTVERFKQAANFTIRDRVTFVFND